MIGPNRREEGRNWSAVRGGGSRCVINGRPVACGILGILIVRDLEGLDVCRKHEA